jgi:methionyl-tRNA formyltransferase
LRLIYFGTAGFAVPSLESLVSAGHELCAVVSAPARPSGRGRKLVPGPVETKARELGLQVLLPQNPNEASFVAECQRLAPELGVLVAYGFILRQALLDVPARGFLNLHPSLLPALRGAAPIQRAIMSGASRTGATVITVSRQVDAGDIAAQTEVDIEPNQTAGELSDQLAHVGAALLLDCATRAEAGTLHPTPQDDTCATPAPKLAAEERLIDWSQPALAIHNRIRGLSPEPGAVTHFRGRQLVLLRSRVVSGSAEPGQLVRGQGRLAVGTGSGLVELVELRPEGGRSQSGVAFANGQRLAPGERLEQ